MILYLLFLSSFVLGKRLQTLHKSLQADSICLYHQGSTSYDLHFLSSTQGVTSNNFVLTICQSVTPPAAFGGNCPPGHVAYQNSFGVCNGLGLASTESHTFVTPILPNVEIVHEMRYTGGTCAGTLGCRQVKITLHTCASNSQSSFQFLNEAPTLTYNFEWFTPDGCVTAVAPPPGAPVPNPSQNLPFDCIYIASVGADDFEYDLSRLHPNSLTSPNIQNFFLDPCTSLAPSICPSSTPPIPSPIYQQVSSSVCFGLGTFASRKASVPAAGGASSGVVIEFQGGDSFQGKPRTSIITVNCGTAGQWSVNENPPLTYNFQITDPAGCFDAVSSHS